MSTYLRFLDSTASSLPATPTPQRLFPLAIQDILLNSVRTDRFDDHLRRGMPSNAPGVDLAIVHPNKKLPNALKPVVRSNVSGQVISTGGQFGSVRIKDRNGFEHRYLHMYLNFEHPVSGPIFPLGAQVEKGQPIGVLGDIHPLRHIEPHLHYSIIAPDGQFIDPDKALFDDSGAVQRFERKTYEELLLDMLGHQRSDGIRYDDIRRSDGSAVA